MDEKTKRGGVLWTALRLVILLAFYPLSAGPLTWLYNCGAFSESTAEYLGSIYFPLVMLGEGGQIPVLWQVFELYVDWWDALPHP